MNAPDPRLGQVMTPPAVADLALALASPRRGPQGLRLLDPACGDGVFLARALAYGFTAVSGVDVDPAAAFAARSRAPEAAIAVEDFLDRPPPGPDGLFDLVVGNPPYVRQELLGAVVKAAIARSVARDWPVDAPALPGRADLALAFVSRALRFLRPGGRLAFVLSAAAIEAGYGSALRALLSGRANLLAVVASPRERWFADAAVHGVLLVAERLPAAHDAAPPALFARLRLPVADAARHLASLDDLPAVADVRHVSAADAVHRPWGPLLRAPEIWFQLADAAGSALRPLGELARVRRGVTSGANEFFYLSRGDAARAGIEPACLRPLLRSPREATTPLVQAGALANVVFTGPDDPDAFAAHPGAAAHVRAHARLARRPSLRGRRPWWRPPIHTARAFLTKSYDTRFAQLFADQPVVGDQRLYALEPRGLDPELLAASLNGTLTALALESLGRASMGEGVLEWSVGDAETLPVLDPRLGDAAAILAAFRRLAARPWRPIAEEVASPDRRALDEALAAGAPPALRALLPAAAAALADTVCERVARARSG